MIRPTVLEKQLDGCDDSCLSSSSCREHIAEDAGLRSRSSIPSSLQGALTTFIAKGCKNHFVPDSYNIKKLSAANIAVITVHSTERKRFFSESAFPTLFKFIVNIDSQELSVQLAGHSSQPCNVPVPFRLKRMQQVVFMLPRKRCEANPAMRRLEG